MFQSQLEVHRHKGRIYTDHIANVKGYGIVTSNVNNEFILTANVRSGFILTTNIMGEFTQNTSVTDAFSPIAKVMWEFSMTVNVFRECILPSLVMEFSKFTNVKEEFMMTCNVNFTIVTNVIVVFRQNTIILGALVGSVNSLVELGAVLIFLLHWW